MGKFVLCFIGVITLLLVCLVFKGEQKKVTVKNPLVTAEEKLSFFVRVYYSFLIIRLIGILFQEHLIDFGRFLEKITDDVIEIAVIAIVFLLIFSMIVLAQDASFGIIHYLENSFYLTTTIYTVIIVVVYVIAHDLLPKKIASTISLSLVRVRNTILRRKRNITIGLLLSAMIVVPIFINL
jgi:uncharacterized membrane protein